MAALWKQSVHQSVPRWMPCVGDNSVAACECCNSRPAIWLLQAILGDNMNIRVSVLFCIDNDECCYKERECVCVCHVKFKPPNQMAVIGSHVHIHLPRKQKNETTEYAIYIYMSFFQGLMLSRIVLAMTPLLRCCIQQGPS